MHCDNWRCFEIVVKISRTKSNMNLMNLTINFMNLTINFRILFSWISYLRTHFNVYLCITLKQLEIRLWALTKYFTEYSQKWTTLHIVRLTIWHHLFLEFWLVKTWFFAHWRQQCVATRLENTRQLNIRRGKSLGFQLWHRQPLCCNINKSWHFVKSYILNTSFQQSLDQMFSCHLKLKNP